MNLDALIPCPGCGLNKHRVLFAPDNPWSEEVNPGEILYEETADGNHWSYDCGDCEYHMDDTFEDRPPTYRGLSPEMAEHIEDLYVLVGKLRRLVNKPAETDQNDSSIC